MHLDYHISGSLPVPKGTTALPGIANQFRLPTGEIISVHPVVEMASSAEADDHRDLSHREASDYGIALELYERCCCIVDDG